MKIQYKNVNPTKLHDELISVNIIPLSVENDRKQDETIAPNTWITFDDTVDAVALKAVIDAHDPTKPSPGIIKQALSDTDASMARIAEDLITVLLAKAIIAETDLSESARTKITERQALRAELSNTVD